MEAVADPEVEEVLAGVERALDRVDAIGVAPVDGRDAYEVARRVERIARRVYSVQVHLVDDIEQRGLFTEDGHRTARALVGFAANLSGADATRRAKAARMLRAMPAVAAGLRCGTIGIAQVDRIARVHANPRVTERLEATDADLAVVAELLRYDQFDRYLRRWEYLADEDGARRRADHDHTRRDFQIRQDLEGRYHVTGRCGSLAGTIQAEILDAYVRAELDADWTEARARLGESATYDDLARTDAQRRADALAAIFDAAVATHAERTGHQIVTNLVIDQATFERTAARLAGADPSADPRLDTWWSDLADTLQEPARTPVHPDTAGTSDTEGSDDRDEDEDAGADEDEDEGTRDVPGASTHRCETLDGRPVDPTEAVAASLIGHIRRVVYDADGVVIDLGRRSRLFTGLARLAVFLTATTCYWPGCTIPVQRCQADHLQPWSEDGRTSPENGAPGCGKHNRFRHRTHTVTRDATGLLHVHRPDGTEIA